MKLGDKIAASDDVVSREVSGEMVLLDLGSGDYFGLNPVGARIWELLEQKVLTLAELCDTIEREFDAPRDEIERDTLALAAELDRAGLILPVAD